jgi:hypothetical protein
MARMICGLLALIWCAAANAQQAQSTREREALSAREADRIVRRDLLSILEPTGKFESGMSMQLRGATLQTPPFGTEFEGLCQRDSATLWYASAGRSTRSEDVPVRPYGLSAGHAFHFLKPPVADPDWAERGADVWNANCRALGDDDNAAWFDAENSLDAIKGVLAFQAAMTAIRSGAVRVGWCDDARDRAKCLADVLAAGDLAKIDQVEACPADSGLVCFDVTAAGHVEFVIVAQEILDSLAPGPIISVKVSEFIVVT